MPRLMLTDELWSQLRTIMLDARVYDKSRLRPGAQGALCSPTHAHPHMVLTAKATAGLPSLLKRLSKIDVLIVDDFSVSLMTDEVRRDFLEVLEDRYGRGSTIITSQLDMSEWHDYLAGGKIADAICDRLIRNAHHFAVKGPSKRPCIGDET